MGPKYFLSGSMMPFAKKLSIYVTGFLLGITILWCLGGEKRKSASTKPYYRRPIQPQDLQSPRPVDPLLAFYYIEKTKPYGLKRVLVYDRVGPSGFIRVEEKLSPSQPPQVLSRQVHIANRFELQLNATTDPASLNSLLERHRLTLVTTLAPGRHTVELPSPSFPMYKNTHQALKQEPCILRVHPIAFP